ncbi:MAG TPA: hypothetical protein QF656_05755 [Nitrosopumilus sp.]|jgi:hypothetical protein|nr:hypothetical protein [Nitrosopumilus sp.]
MKTGILAIVIGGMMFFVGLIVFYGINPDDDKNLEYIKNMGTFVGLTGIGVVVAGVLLYLINRNQQPIKENYDM